MKMDIFRDMNRTNQTPTQNSQTQNTQMENNQMQSQAPLSEQETLEMRLSLLNQQENLKLKNNAELLKALSDLNKNIKEASKEVQRSAQEVRNYPVEVIAKNTTRMEQCLMRCEESAKKASMAYDNASELITDYENSLTKNILFGVLTSSIFASLMTGIIVIWRLKG